MTTRSIKLVAILAAAALGCNQTASGPAYNPQIPTDWVSAVTNPYFPLGPGTTYQYQGQTTAGLETNTVEVLTGIRLVNGVAATIVHDRVFLNGSLIEDTYDWYAQDGVGNVWYLGEDSKEIANGQVVSTEGSWEWGVDGALPGIIMWGDPAAHIGEEYRQEFYAGVAEDWAKVLTLNQSVDVPYGNLTGCITTEDRNGLEPDEPRQNKSYCRQIGLALEVVVGGGERVELVARTTP